MKRLLITGAGGFIGRACLAPALAAGYELHGVAHATRPSADLSGPAVKWHVADLLSGDAAERLIADVQPTHVLHAAWLTNHATYWTSADNLKWVAVSMRLIEAFAAHKGERFVAVGTCAEYDWNHGFMAEGVTPEKPSTLYGAAKLAQHAMLTAAGREFAFSAATGRIFFGYGPYENENRIIPYICRQIIRGETAQLSSGAVYRDFMYVDDIGRGLVALLDSDIQGPCNVCSGVPTRLSDLMRQLGDVAESAATLQIGARPDRPGDPPMLVGSNETLRRTGWAPRVDLRQGLAMTYTWWRDNASRRAL